MVSMNEDWWYWTSEVPTGRVKGRTGTPKDKDEVNRRDVSECDG
jgi:hypothetical protein